jgi:ABC-type antimicrobial peptide transport system permease subunit
VVTWAINQGPLGPALKEEIPEIADQARFLYARWRIKHDSDIYVERGGYTDPSIFKMFTFPFVAGDPEKALADPRSVVLTERVAKKIFGIDDPLGQTIQVADKYDFKVSGIIQDVPDNSNLVFDFLANMDFAKEVGRTVDNWKNSQFTTFVLLPDNVSMEIANEKIYNFLDAKPTLEDWEKLSLQPLHKIRLASGIGYDFMGTGNAKYVAIFLAAALFILFLACINYINLSTARSLLRAREVGLRKVVGAFRRQLVRQFLGESILQSSLAMLLALGLGIMLLPAFNKISMRNFSSELFLRTDIIIGYLGIVIFSGIIAGSYPAFVLSSFRPVTVLRGTVHSISRRSMLRKALVVSQFSISVILLIGSLVIYLQVNHLKNQDLGYAKENLVTLYMNEHVQKNYDSFRNELLENPDITNVARTSGLPNDGYYFSNARWSWEGKDPEKDVLFRANFVDIEYFDTLKIQTIQGRTFSRDFTTDTEAIVINETSARVMGFENPIGKRVKLGEDNEFHIIGVVKDYHYVSLHTEIEPLILLLVPDRSNDLMARILPKNVHRTLEYMETTWKKFAGDYTFDFRFMDDRLDLLYRSEHRAGRIAAIFTVLAIFVSCLGLFGLASFMALRRTKEIGVRKVLGAPISGIVILLTKEFSKWVLLANVVAWPLAYWAMNSWLKDFPYRMEIKPWIFLLSGFLTFLISILTISYQTVKSALANPVDSLRYE